MTSEAFPAKPVTSSAAVFKITEHVLGCFDPQRILLNNETNIFRGDLTSSSAIKEPLIEHLDF